jgi:hypothetical protein
VLDPGQRLLACHRDVTTSPSNAATDPVSVAAHGLEGTGTTMSGQPIDSSVTEARVEARWPILTAVVVIMTLTALRPAEIRLAAPWVLPTIEIALLAAVLTSHPARVGRLAGLLRGISIAVVGFVALDTLAATVRLIDVLIHGGQATNSAEELLTVGGVIWASNVVAFALLYWLLDSGGAAARAQGRAAHPDLAFPQQLNPELARAGWQPQFIDYLYLGLTASTAFSPTDVMPLVPWAKVAMGAQSLISLAVLGLIVARAVNVFT